jgi:hypothetical protein
MRTIRRMFSAKTVGVRIACDSLSRPTTGDSLIPTKSTPRASDGLGVSVPLTRSRFIDGQRSAWQAFVLRYDGAVVADRGQLWTRGHGARRLGFLEDPFLPLIPQAPERVRVFLTAGRAATNCQASMRKGHCVSDLRRRPHHRLKGPAPVAAA